jgi:hypothetical protein
MGPWAALLLLPLEEPGHWASVRPQPVPQSARHRYSIAGSPTESANGGATSIEVMELLTGCGGHCRGVGRNCSLALGSKPPRTEFDPNCAPENAQLRKAPVAAEAGTQQVSNHVLAE